MTLDTEEDADLHLRTNDIVYMSDEPPPAGYTGME